MSRDQDPLLGMYLGEIRDTSLLDARQERDLARRIRTGCEKSLRRLVEANLPFVVHQARRFRVPEIPFLDLVAEGNLGLLRAAREFDPERGTRFSTYAAWWIREAIGHLLARGSFSVSLPEKKARAARRLEATRLRILSEDGKAPEEDRLAEEAQVERKELRNLALAARHAAPLEEVEGALEVGHHGLPGAETQLGRRERGARLERLLALLEPRERLCLRLYFGIPGGPCQSFQEIGRLVNLGREGARLLFHRALARLRRMPEIREFLGDD